MPPGCRRFYPLCVHQSWVNENRNIFVTNSTQIFRVKFFVAPFISLFPLFVQNKDLIYKMLDVYTIYGEITGYHNIVLIMEWKWLISEEREKENEREIRRGCKIRREKETRKKERRRIIQKTCEWGRVTNTQKRQHIL